MKRIKTEITIETNEILLVKGRENAFRAWCAQCRETVRFVGVDQAATIAGVSQHAMYSDVDVGHVHFVATPEGRICICLNSLG